MVLAGPNKKGREIQKLQIVLNYVKNGYFDQKILIIEVEMQIRLKPQSDYNNRLCTNFVVF